MQREIKFRVWLTDRMDYNVGFHPYMTLNLVAADIADESEFKNRAERFIWSPGLCELMQYTGLKDKNGIDIYEGDILQFIQVKSDGFHCSGGSYNNEPNKVCKGQIKHRGGAYYISGDYYPGTIYLHEISTDYNDGSEFLDCCRVHEDRIGGYNNATYNDFEVIGNIHQNLELL